MDDSSKPIKLIKNTFFNEEHTKQALADFILKSERLSMGDHCRRFEVEFSRYYNRNHSVLVNSGSSANLCLLQALMNLGLLKKGDKVAFSAVTWSTNVMPIIQLGLTPIPVDVDLATLNVDSKQFKEFLYKFRPRTFFITNLLGFCADLENIKDLCDSNDIIFIEDNCESFGSIYKGKKLGNFGFASTYSFFVGHHLSAIEGGAICCDDEELNNMITMVRAHGWDRSLSPEKQKELRSDYSVDSFYDQYTFYDLGYNLRPTEITGFVANLQLACADEMISRRNKNFFSFHEAATKNNSFESLSFDHMDLVSNFAYPIICKTKALFEHYKKVFIENNVEIRPIVSGNMVLQPFFLKYSKDRYKLHNADIIHELGFYFPNNPDMDEEEIRKLVTLLT